MDGKYFHQSKKAQKILTRELSSTYQLPNMVAFQPTWLTPSEPTRPAHHGDKRLGLTDDFDT